MKKSPLVDNRRQSQKCRKHCWFLRHTIMSENNSTHPSLQSVGCASWRRGRSQSLLCVGPPARWNDASSSWAPRDLTPGIAWVHSLTSVSFPPCPQCSSAPRRRKKTHKIWFMRVLSAFHERNITPSVGSMLLSDTLSQSHSSSSFLSFFYRTSLQRSESQLLHVRKSSKLIAKCKCII